MTGKGDRSDDAARLRQKAEEIARRKAASSGKEDETLDPEETRRMLHELRVHEVELEIQNEELRRAQLELEASRERYFDLYDLAPVGYCTLSEKGVIVETNFTAATLLNVTRRELIRQTFSHFVLAEDQDIYYLLQKRLLETGDPQDCELRMVNAKHKSFWVRLDATACKEEDGATVCRVVLTDISERKQTEEERARLETQLNQAQKMESVGRLAGGVAHDFNNMLSVIMGNAELAMHEANQDTLHDLLQNIINAGRHSAKIVQQLLAFARKQTVSPRRLDLNSTVEEMLQMLRSLISEDIHLAWRPAKDAWPVRMDPSQIDQILLNLCINARDAITGTGTGTGTGTIIIKTVNRRIDKEDCVHHDKLIAGDFVVLSVSDDGAGIAPDTVSNLFEPFFTTKDIDEGKGLGLAVVYGIVKQNKGFIEVDGEPGKETTFKIYIPRYESDEEPPREKEAPAVADIQGGETILVVDDEREILRVTMRMLESLGYSVLTAEIPDEAIEVARSHSTRIHLLVTDVIMPGMNGGDLARKLSSLNPELKCLFMSGYSANLITEGGILAPSVHFIQKPFSMNELGSRVREVLNED